MEENKEIINNEFNSIKLSRGMKGNYSWEIKILGVNERNVLRRIEEINIELLSKYSVKTINDIESLEKEDEN